MLLPVVQHGKLHWLIPGWQRVGRGHSWKMGRQGARCSTRAWQYARSQPTDSRGSTALNRPIGAPAALPGRRKNVSSEKGYGMPFSMILP